MIITTILVLTLFTTCIEYGYVSSGKRYVSVSGYRRKDGTYVQPYKRSYPGEKNKSAGTSYRWLYGIGIIVVALGGIYLAVSYDNAKNLNNRPGGKDGTGGNESYYVKSDNIEREENTHQKDKKNATLKPIVETDFQQVNSNLPRITTCVLDFNEIFGERIIEPVSYSVVYDLEQYLTLDLAHKLYDIGCPYLIIRNDNRVYVREAIYGDRFDNYYFNFSTNPSKSYNHIPYAEYKKLINNTLEKYNVYLQFEERKTPGGYYWGRSSSHIYFKDRPGFSFSSNTPACYSREVLNKWGYEDTMQDPINYCYIQVKDIYGNALKHKFKKEYHRLQNILKEDWTQCKSENSYRIFRTKQPQNDIIKSDEILLLESA